MTHKLTKIQESILILCTLQALLDEYRKCLFNEKDNTESVIYSIIVSQIILTSCSYIEEWELFGKLAKSNSKIKELRKVAKPAVNRIKEWSDMREVRNSLIAHNHRIRKANNSPIVFSSKRELKCPNSYYDYRLLMGCIYLTKNILLRVFKTEYNEMVPNVKNLSSFKAKTEIIDESEYKFQFDEIIQTIQSNLDKYNSELASA